MMKLRPATPNDINLLKFWDTQQHLIKSLSGDTWDWEKELAHKPKWREQYIATCQNEPIGFVQIIDPYLEETHYWGIIEKNKRAVDLWIGETKNLNKGYVTRMMTRVLERCFENPNITGVLVDPLKTNLKAHRFYQKMGFVFVEERLFNGTACYVYERKRTSIL